METGGRFREARLSESEEKGLKGKRDWKCKKTALKELIGCGNREQAGGRGNQGGKRKKRRRNKEAEEKFLDRRRGNGKDRKGNRRRSMKGINLVGRKTDE